MSLADVSNLRSSITSWLLGRTDLAPQVDDFIALNEADINMVLRVREMEASSDLTPVDGVATLPADYLAWRTVTALTSPRRDLDFVAPSAMPDACGTIPRTFTITGDSLVLDATGTFDVRLAYYARIPALSDANTTNWLLEKAPNVYLFGCLKYAAVFISDEAAASMYGTLFVSTMEALMVADKGARWARGGVRLEGPTP